MIKCVTLYTRYPGTYCDFFVQEVVHTFRTAAPSDGQANTVVRFNCGRLGSLAQNIGLQKVSMYSGLNGKDFNASTSLTFASDFAVLV